MRSLRLILITGRSTEQGTGISVGKDGPEYREATGVVELNPADMRRSGLDDGAFVSLRTEFGEAGVRCRGTEIPEGLAFIAFGSACNQLVGGETSASGMPDSKHVEVELTPVSPSPAAAPTSPVPLKAESPNGKF